MHRQTGLDLERTSLSVGSAKNYTIFLAPASLSGVIRLVVYVHKDIVVKPRDDLMSPDLCSVWLEAGYKNHKRFIINQTYREWQQLGGC